MQSSPAKSSLAHFSPHLHVRDDGPIKVRAIMRGYYGDTLRHPGAIFGINSEEEFAPWMEKITDEEAHAAEQPEMGLEPPAAPKRGSKSAKAKQSDNDVL